MRSYEVGIEYYFREIGQKVPAGTVITLRQGDAERYMVSHPGLLKPLPMTTQARPQAIRSEPEVPVQTVEAAPEAPAPVAEPEPVKEEPKPEAPAEEPAAKPAPAEVTPEASKADEADAKPKAKSRAKKS